MTSIFKEFSFSTGSPSFKLLISLQLLSKKLVGHGSVEEKFDVAVKVERFPRQ